MNDEFNVDLSDIPLEDKPVPALFSLNDDQEAAVVKILEWMKDPKSLDFVFEGPAGAGKTYTLQALLSRIKGRVCFTAPTNKATKVLRDVLTTKEYKPECRTIYSLLGLKMEPNGEVKELTSGKVEDIDLSLYALIVVDESGMVNPQLRKFAKNASQEHRTKFLWMGDRNQLPPVGEIISPVWKEADSGDVPHAGLTKVMRHDNQILTLATALRGQINHPAPNFRPVSDNDNEQGVWALNLKQMEGFVSDSALLGEFQSGKAKVIAWRNLTVDRWNQFIRRQMFENVTIPWYVGERVIFTAPAKDLDDETIATTDDEGIIQSVGEDWHPVYGEFKTFRISIILDSGLMVVARVLHPECQSMFTRKTTDLADAAKTNGRMWREFWNFKDSFHMLRHAYAITAHRSQGSTYPRVFVEYKDILQNRTRKEAFQCLYVACTRAKRELYLA